MAQKILSARAGDPTLAGDMVAVAVDQIVLSRAPMRAHAAAVAAGLKKPTAEVAIAYDSRCITGNEAAFESTRAASRGTAEQTEMNGRQGESLFAGLHDSGRRRGSCGDRDWR